MRRFARSAITVGAVAVTAIGVTVYVAAGQAASAQPAVVKLKPTGSVDVTYRGNGHGHGLSQYGAYGAALAGRTYPQILASYYDGTKLTKGKSTWIRVRLSNTGSTTTVQAYRGMTLTGPTGDVLPGFENGLPTKGIHRYRLQAGNGSRLVLRELPWNSTKWKTVQIRLPDGTGFHRSIGQGMRLIHPDGSSIFYYGFLRANRGAARGASGGVHTVNRTSLERYTAGVTPREMPISWSRAAVDAQAVAARTYGYYHVVHPQSESYDICDTTACQVFGGHRRYDRSAHTQWLDFPQAAHDTSYRFLTYAGDPIFAQFSASNGGWSTDGGQPYLRAAADPYDPGGSGDPYINAHRTVKVSALAHSVGLSTATKLTITERDGHGTWGGRVLSAVVSGTSGKKPATRTVSGYDLQRAFGLGTTWLNIAAA